MKNTVLCYPERDGRLLMLYRNKKPHDDNAGKWIGVGGKIEDGEAPEDTLLREIREETGLTLTRYRRRGLITFVSDVYGTEYMHLFTADDWKGSLIDCSEGTLAWIPKEEVATLPLWEGDRVFLPLLDRDIPYFSLKLCYQGDTLISQAFL